MVPVAALPSVASTTPPAAEIVVSVVGLVQEPGLVTLAPGARVADAIEAVGGGAKGADLVALNMAQRLNDGDQVVVGEGAGASRTSAVVTSGGLGNSPSGVVNLNTATEAELDQLPGVGPVTAAAIVSRRKNVGRFQSVDQLAEVEGIGPSRLAKLRELVTV